MQSWISMFRIGSSTGGESREEIRGWSSFRKTAYLLLPLLIYFVVHDVAELVLWGIMEGVLSGGGEDVVTFVRENAYTLQGVINGLAALIGVAAVWKMAKKEIAGEAYANGVADDRCFSVNRRTGEARQRLGNEMHSGEWLLLIALAFCAAVGVNFLFGLTGLAEQSAAYSSVAKKQYGVEFAAGLILYGIVSPFAEETVFRGLLYNRMKKCFSYPIALVLSALFFGLYHGNVVQAVYGGVLGLLIAYVYEKYHNFMAPVLFHAVANCSVFAMTYRGRFENVSQGVSMGIMAALLAVAGICLWRIKRLTNQNDGDK